MTFADPRRPFAFLLAVGLALFLGAGSARAAGSRVTGRVVDAETQAPIAGADVELENLSGGQGYFRARTNAHGEFTLDRVPPERWYTFSVGARGYADFVLGGWQFPATQRAVELVVPLDRAGVLDLRVTRSDGRTPVAGARVTVTQERGASWWEGAKPPPAPQFTGADGAAHYEGLRAGAYTVTADVAGLRPVEARNVSVRRGETTRVSVVMTRPASLSGALRLADGTPVAGVPVTARGPVEAVGTTDTDGAFAIGDLAPGRYRLDVSADGFQPLVTKESYALAEGAARDGIALTASPKAPELAFVIEREAFTPDASVTVTLRSFRVDDVDLAVYHVPDGLLLDPARDVRRFAAAGDTTGLERVLAWRHVMGAGPEWAWREGTVVVPQKLPPGAYVLRGTSGDLRKALLFFVTDLGLMVKRSSSRVVASVASLTTGDPLNDVRVFALAVPSESERGPTVFARALAQRQGVPPVRTDGDGLAVVPTPGGIPATQGAAAAGSTRIRVVAVSVGHGVAIADAPLAPAAERGGDQVFLYTDRPLYRPGHTVYWKAFARKANGTGYALPDVTRLALAMTGPDGASLDVPAATLDEHGGADGAIPLPNDVALGDWSLRASAGPASGGATVGVQQYRKPEFSVDVTPDRDVYVNGDEVRFRVAASYFFGAPVFGATVRYNLFESRLPGDADDAAADEAPGGYGRVLKTGETRTDVDGRADLVFTPERVAYDRRLTLEVEVVDASNRAVNGRGAAIVGRGLFRLTVRPRAWVVAPGAAVPLEVTTLDHQGKPVSAAVTVDLDQEAWSPLTHRYTRSTRPLATATVTTDRAGRAALSLAPSPARPGQILVHARATDAKGNRITADASVWAWDADVTDYAYRYPALEAFADRERYRAGDTVKVLVNTEVRDARVFATLEGRDLYETRTLRLAGGTGLVAFAIRPEYAPNAFVTVNVRKGREVYSRTLEVAIDAERHDLAITLRPDRDRYAPGDTAHVDVETRDAAGRPAPAELSVGVIDESIYSLRPDATPDPHDVFYGRRPDWVTTTLAFPSLLLGGADKGGREEPRKNFRDVAAWAPNVRTDADGRARVDLRYPDNLTTWRITSRGLTDATLVGKAVTKTLVTKDLVARLAGPRFLIAGDQAKLVSIVDNRADHPIADGEATLAARGATLAGPARVTFAAPAHGEARAEWTVKAPADVGAGAPAVFTFRARGKTDSDALEVPVPLRPRAVRLVARGGGVVDAASRAVTIALPPNLIRVGSDVTLDLSLSPAGMAAAGVDALFAYPYGCTEQTSNGILAAAAWVRAVRAIGHVPAGWEKPADTLGPLVRRLAGLQLPDGGWGWWNPGEFDPFLTVLAMDALAQALELDVAPADAERALDNAASAVPRAIGETRSLDGEAYLLAHLASVAARRHDDAAFATLRANLGELADPLYAARKDLGNAALALTAQGLATLGREAQAKELTALLLSRAVTDANGLHWQADGERASAWFGEDLDATGSALSAVVRVTPRESRAADVVRWLAAHRTGLAWRSTRETAPVTVALAEYLAARPSESKPEGKLRVEWNGQPVLERDVHSADAFAARSVRMTLADPQLRPGDNRLAITRPGGSAVFYAWESRALVPSPGPAAPRNARLTVQREFLRAERTEDRRGRPQYLSTPLAAGEPLRVGEQVLVRLTVRATQALDFALIEDPRVAGFEIDALLPDGVDRPYGTNAEERDDHVAFFVSHLDEGDTVIEYLARPELAGTFTALPTEASGMYEPDLRARSAEQPVTVEAKP